MRSLLILFTLMLSGCAATVLQVDVPNINNSNAITIADLRPATEPLGEIFSYSISNDAYGTYRIEEKSVSPTPLRIFQHRAFEKFGADAQQLNIKVHHFVIYKNLQSQLRTGVFGGLIGGPLGAAIAVSTIDSVSGSSSTVIDREGFDALQEDEFKRALYTEKENPDNGPVFIYFIETEMKGKSTFTRTLAPAERAGDPTPFVTGLNAAIEFHLNQY